MRKVLVVAGFALQEAVRRRVVRVLLIVASLLILLYGFSMHSAWARMIQNVTEIQARAVAWTTTQAVLGVLNFMVTGAAIFLGASSISGELRDGSLHVLLPRSISRTQFYLGKLLALALITLGFGVVLAGGVGVAALWAGPGFPPGYWWVLLFFAVPPLFLAVLTQALGTRMGTIPAALIGVVAWVMAKVGSVLETIASLGDIEALQSSGILISLLVPVDAVYRWMTAHWISAMGPVGALFQAVEGSAGSTPSVWMLAWAAGWLVVVAWLGIRSLRSRDL